MKNRDILKYLIEHQVRKFLKEQDEEVNKIAPIASFEDDPISYILATYPTLEQNLIMLLSNVFKDYITGIYITAPKPLTFKIVLHNGQEFLLTDLGRAYEATILARRYYLLTIGDKEKAVKAVRNLLQLGRPINTQGPGEEAPTEQPAESETTSPEGGSPEEEKTES